VLYYSSAAAAVPSLYGQTFCPEADKSAPIFDNWITMLLVRRVTLELTLHPSGCNDRIRIRDHPKMVL